MWWKIPVKLKHWRQSLEMYLTLFIQEDTGKDSFIRKALMMLKKVIKIVDFLLSAVMAILGSTLLMMVVLLLVKLFMGDVYGL